jgi:hypothetical protein
MKHQQSGLGGKHYVRQLPYLSQQQFIAAARQEADASYSGHQAGIHPENRPFHSQELTHSSTSKRIASTRVPATFDAEGEYDIEEDERFYTTRLPTSSRRYQVSPEDIYQQGNTRYHVRHVDVPRRKSRQAQLPQSQQRDRHIEEYEVAPQSRRKVHPLGWIGFILMVFVLGWIGLNFVTTWFQEVQNDWTFGQQRHFEINAFVGHSDSATNPSHFTAENNNGQIIVIELPGNNVSKAKIYQIETVPGNAGNPPVKLSFQDMNGDGKPDMLVQIGDGAAMIYLTLFNNSSEFVSKI